MKNPETSTPAGPRSGGGFRISDEPIVRLHRPAGSHSGVLARELPASYDTDFLYLIAHDPKSLFVYWDLNWTRLFAQAGLSAPQVQLRIYREDGSIVGTHEINPFRGHCYADVATAGTKYYCELGCFEDDAWQRLARSGKAMTPEDRMSEDLSAQFATLPMHLSFQRLLDILRATKADGAKLAGSVAELQESAHVIRDTVTPEEWSRLVAAVSPLNGTNGGPSSSDLSALLQTARVARPTAEQLAQWSKLGEDLGGASGGAPGGSSPG